jgi:hypothetical protein
MFSPGLQEGATENYVIDLATLGARGFEQALDDGAAAIHQGAPSPAPLSPQR